MVRQKSFLSVDSQNKRAENEIAVFSLSDAEIWNAIRSYENRKASTKKRKDLAVLAKTSRLSSKTFKQQQQLR